MHTLCMYMQDHMLGIDLITLICNACTCTTCTYLLYIVYALDQDLYHNYISFMQCVM